MVIMISMVIMTIMIIMRVMIMTIVILIIIRTQIENAQRLKSKQFSFCWSKVGYHSFWLWTWCFLFEGVFLESVSEFTVDAKTVTSTGEGKVKALITNPSGTVTEGLVTNKQDGTYECLYTPLEQGRFFQLNAWIISENFYIMLSPSWFAWSLSWFILTTRCVMGEKLMSEWPRKVAWHWFRPLVVLIGFCVVLNRTH